MQGADGQGGAGGGREGEEGAGEAAAPLAEPQARVAGGEGAEGVRGDASSGYGAAAGAASRTPTVHFLSAPKLPPTATPESRRALQAAGGRTPWVCDVCNIVFGSAQVM